MANEGRRGNPRGTLAGTLWFFGSLFNIGFAQLSWWKIIVGIVL